MKSSIFLDEITVIDHAYVSGDQIVRGGSYEFSCIVTGEVSSDEAVVVDFSTIKHDIKHFIDAHYSENYTNGLDHKLWLLKDSYKSLNYNSNNSITIETSTFIATLPLDAVKIIEEVNEHTIENIAEYLEMFLGERLKEKYPLVDISIKCHLSETPVFYDESITDYIMFRYVHGLKNSTSYACQSLCHGHLSYIQSSQLKDPQLVAKIKADIDDVIFIMKENILEEDNETMTIGYTTARGKFRCIYKKRFYKLIVLETETTIEYLTNYIKDKYGIKETLYVSEGLSKGSMID